MLDVIKKKILITTAIAGVLYLLFAILSNYQNVINAFSRFDWFLIPVVLLLTFLNFCIRFIKWDYYLSILKVKISKVDSFFIFMSGLIMSITPGKMGEVMKSYLVKQLTNEPISKTAPIILVERITDFLSLIIIALVGAYSFDFGRTIVIAVGLFFVLIVVVISNNKLSKIILTLLERVKFLRKHLTSINSAYESSYQLLKLKPLLLMTFISFFSWGLECLGYYIILTNFGMDITILWASFAYSFATIVGAVSMLPGGLGVTDGSLTFFVLGENYSLDIAFASTFIVRAATLWFAVVIGIISVLIYQKRYGKILLNNFK
ncbi:MAG: TIGR00374 family protein [Chlorobiaceae bacterium]|nr:TIGR00374 family protein [Chlorobiaceae bacterium]MBA4310005.1 TIGR00374 family protein [Chlorobiaceae bacterium]